MKVVILLVALAWSSVARADASDKITVVARVVDAPSYGYCGIRAIFGVVRYEVVAVEAGSYSDKDLYVIVLCPESYKPGMKHRIRAARTKWKKGEYYDGFTAPAPRYRATKIDRG